MIRGKNSFEVETPGRPYKVDTITVRLNLRETEEGREYKARYEFYILDENGEARWLRSGDLLPHLTDSQKNHLKGFLDALKTKVDGVIG